MSDIHRDGFVVVPQVLRSDFLASLRVRAYATLFREAAARAKAVATGSLINLNDHPEFADLVGAPAIVDMLYDLGATDPRFSSGFLISKPPGGPPLFWHQDWWGWSEAESYASRPQQWFVMVYLTDTTIENGCLRVVPGSHRRPHPLHLLEAAHSEDLTLVRNPDDPAFAGHPDEVAVPVRAGDIVVGDARLLHSAHGNRSDAERPLITLWYMPHYSSMTPALQAGVIAQYARGRDPASGAEMPLTPHEWPLPLRALIAPLLPPRSTSVTAAPWQRTPDIDRLSAAA